MEVELRAALIDWLHADATLSGAINAIAEEAPAAVSAPWLAIAASASADWSTKTQEGREVRVALELHCRGDDPVTGRGLAALVQDRVRAFPREQATFQVATTHYLRGRSERRANNRRAVLLEYRFRCLATP